MPCLSANVRRVQIVERSGAAPTHCSSVAVQRTAYTPATALRSLYADTAALRSLRSIVATLQFLRRVRVVAARAHREADRDADKAKVSRRTVDEVALVLSG